jgi:hypothetical protein
MKRWEVEIESLRVEFEVQKALNAIFQEMAAATGRDIFCLIVAGQTYRLRRSGAREAQLYKRQGYREPYSLASYEDRAKVLAYLEEDVEG